MLLYYNIMASQFIWNYEYFGVLKLWCYKIKLYNFTMLQRNDAMILQFYSLQVTSLRCNIVDKSSKSTFVERRRRSRRRNSTSNKMKPSGSRWNLKSIQDKKKSNNVHSKRFFVFFSFCFCLFVASLSRSLLPHPSTEKAHCITLKILNMNVMIARLEISKNYFN